MSEQPRCHCGADALARYRILPYAGRDPLTDAIRRAQGSPVDAYVCGNPNHQREAREAGVVLVTEALGEDVVRRAVS